MDKTSGIIFWLTKALSKFVFSEIKVGHNFPNKIAYKLLSVIFPNVIIIMKSLLHIDLWQNRQSMISKATCSSCVNKAITGKQAIRGCNQCTGSGSRGLTTRGTGRRHKIIYTRVPTSEQSVSNSVGQFRGSESNQQVPRGGSAPTVRKAEEVLSGALDMEAQRG